MLRLRSRSCFDLLIFSWFSLGFLVLTAGKALEPFGDRANLPRLRIRRFVSKWWFRVTGWYHLRRARLTSRVMIALQMFLVFLHC